MESDMESVTWGRLVCMATLGPETLIPLIALAILGLKGYFQHTETGTHTLYKPLPTGNKKGFRGCAISGCVVIFLELVFQSSGQKL